MSAKVSTPNVNKACGEPTIDVAEAAGFALLCVVKTTGPVDSNVALGAVQSGRTLHATAGADSAELEETIEHRAIVAHVILALLPHVAVHVVGSDLLQEVNVVVGMELRHLAPVGRFRAL